jgi:glycogen phosphorylase
MMESINFRTGISESLLRTTQAALAEIPYRFYTRSQNATITSPMHSRSLPRTVERNRDRWLVDAELVKIESPTPTATPEFNPRQWLLSGNPRLSRLIAEAIGDRWMTHQEDLQQLAPIADDPLLQSRWRAVKQVNKQALANDLYRTQGISVNVNSLFDLQLQLIGGHQRQLLNVLHIIALFDRIKQNPGIDILPRTFIFGDLGESTTTIEIDTMAEAEHWALPSSDYPWYGGAEERTVANSNRAILALIKSLAKVLAADPDVSEKLQVIYVPESAGLTSQMYAAADLTQQIATAAIEDVDLSSLKATVNGVLSIGSLGKTNYWLQQTVGEQNCFRFGLAIPEIALFKEYGYDPYNYYKYYPQVRQAIDCLLAGYFTPSDSSLGRSIVDLLLGADEHMVLADYIFYAACQSHISETYRQASIWTQMSILNVAGVR